MAKRVEYLPVLLNGLKKLKRFYGERFKLEPLKYHHKHTNGSQKISLSLRVSVVGNAEMHARYQAIKLAEGSPLLHKVGALMFGGGPTYPGLTATPAEQQAYRAAAKEYQRQRDAIRVAWLNGETEVNGVPIPPLPGTPQERKELGQALKHWPEVKRYFLETAEAFYSVGREFRTKYTGQGEPWRVSSALPTAKALAACTLRKPLYQCRLCYLSSTFIFAPVEALESKLAEAGERLTEGVENFAPGAPEHYYAG